METLRKVKEKIAERIRFVQAIVIIVFMALLDVYDARKRRRFKN